MIDKEFVPLIFFIWFIVGFFSMIIGAKTTKDLTIIGKLLAGPFIVALYITFTVQDVFIAMLYKKGGK